MQLVASVGCVRSGFKRRASQLAQGIDGCATEPLSWSHDTSYHS